MLSEHANCDKSPIRNPTFPEKRLLERKEIISTSHEAFRSRE